MKLTTLANTALAVIAIAIAAASSTTSDLGTRPQEKISQATHHPSLAISIHRATP